MNLIHQTEAKAHQNGQACQVYEYEFLKENDINNAVAKLDGRYPERGYAVNRKSKELLYVMEGAGVVVAGGKLHVLSEGDTGLIATGEEYYLVGKMKLLITSVPAWRPDQAENIGGDDPVRIGYTNWRGEKGDRNILPLEVWHGATQWHPEEQWLLRAFDVEKQAERDFALKDIVQVQRRNDDGQ